MTNKTLLLLRHAKSSWEDLQLDDRERPLNGRGRRAAARIGRRLRDEGLVPDLVLCSTAKRTLETAALVFAELPTLPSIVYRDELYHAETAQIANLLREVVEPARCVMVIGHNPGLEDFLAWQMGEAFSLPTAALAHIDLELDAWSLFKNLTRGRLVQLWRPRELDAD